MAFFPQVSHKSVILAVTIIAAASVVFGYRYLTTRDAREYSRVTYLEQCANCHGAQLRGTAGGTDLLAANLRYGGSTQELMESLSRDIEEHRNVDWPSDPEKNTVKALALFIAEHRESYPPIEASYFRKPDAQTVQSEHHSFSVETFAELQSRPYSIAPLPDGRILVSEKVRGLSLVDSDGSQGKLITGTPPVYEQLLSVQGTYVGWGQFLDVALHPQYEDNGWIYLSFTDRCPFNCGSPIPQTMVKVVRGRIKDGNWVDEETIWSVDRDYYTVVPDGVAGGRLAFDKAGHLYITVGGKAAYGNLHIMDTPYGKIHRVREDGAVPEDNPFWVPADQREDSSTRHTVWSYGHRTTQGLEAHPLNGEIWSTEMGPRGGDEVNLISKGGNYGWPLYTNGLDYDSTEVSIGKDLGLEFPESATVAPIVDFTPAPAISNLTIHHGQRFPGWRNDLLVGSLKAMAIYRLRIEDGVLIEKETLAKELGRIRDVAMGADGLVYIAVEHGDVGSILRLVPSNPE